MRVALALLAAAVVPACGGSSGSPSAAILAVPGPTTAYDGRVILDTPGTKKILSRGGTGSTLAGGSGGGVRVHNLSGSEAKVLKTGSVDATSVIPTTLPTLGTNPRTIAVDTELSPGAGLFPGQQFILGDDGATPATGLHILPGVTLTLHPQIDTFNQDADNDASTGDFEGCYLVFSQAVLIEGTLQTAAKDAFSQWMGDLYLQGAGTIMILPGGKISTRGADQAGTFGDSAGFAWLFSFGSIVNRGTIDASGSNGTQGGFGSTIYMESAYWAIYNSGPLVSKGGDGSDGPGGAAGSINVLASTGGGSFTGGGVLNSGDWTATGGNGTTGGGQGNTITSTTDTSDGPFFSTGTLNSSGGRAWIDGVGGAAGQIVVRSRGGEARVSGALFARGGKGAGSGNGGNGAFIQISADNITAQPVGAGAYVSADLDNSGGDGAKGGNADLIEVWNNATFGGPFVRPGEQPTILVGYLILDASGGNGNTAGGNAGGVELNNWAANDAGGTPHLQSFLNEADLASRGGNAFNGPGGAGNYVFFAARNNFASIITTDDRQIINRGAVIVHGGNGVTGGNGGTFTMTDPRYVKNEGAVTTSGGSGTTGPGGFGNVILMTSDGQMINTGVLTANGGASNSGNGNAGGQATVQGFQTSQSGTMSARGGNSGSGAGGNGGRLRVLSFSGVDPSVISGFLDVRGGAGAAVGIEGQIVIDGIFVAMTNGTLTY
jgi:hypothetical protein